MSDTMPDLATITAAGVTDFAEKISEICTIKKGREKVKEELRKLGEITITKNGHEKKFVVPVAGFYEYGGSGIIIGLNDSGKSDDDLQYVLKFDCVPNPKYRGETLRTAIRINEEFTKYGQGGEYTNNMAMYYGNVGTTSDGPPSHPPMSFAVYKYLGEELRNILFEKTESLPLDGKKKTIVNVISCIMRFNKNLFLHGDISIENFVYNSRTGEIELIDFDTMQNLTEISKSHQCTLDVYEGKLKICPIPNIPEQCLTYGVYWRRFYIPNMYSLFDIKRRNEKKYTLSIVTNLMRVDKIGLFWVIIKILLSSGPTGKSEGEIEELLGITVIGDMEEIMKSYITFYEKNNSSIDFFVPILVEKLKLGDGDILFKDFIKKLLEFIQVVDVYTYHRVEMDTLLEHPFLFLTRFKEKVNLFMENKTVEAYESIYHEVDIYTRMKIAKYLSLEEKQKIRETLENVNAAYAEYEKSLESQEPVSGHAGGHAGGNIKNRASSGNRTKKRNKRNKQNRRNRTKKTKSRTRLVRRYK